MILSFSKVLLLNEVPVKTGLEKLVFFHPEYSNILIKVINPSYVGRLYKRWPIMMRLERSAHYWIFLKEIVESFSASAAGVSDRKYLQRFIGLVDTDLGMGMMTEAVLQKDGTIAPTIGDLIKNNLFGDNEMLEFNSFCSWVLGVNLIFRDFDTTNIVWNEKENCFVIIDGIGGRIRPSFRSLSKKYNKKKNQYEVQKLRNKVSSLLEKNQLLSVSDLIKDATD